MSGIYLCSSGTVTGHLAQAKKHVHKHQPLLNCMKKVNISPVFQWYGLYNAKQAINSGQASSRSLSPWYATTKHGRSRFCEDNATLGGGQPQF